jgi:hypothetical protein
MVLLFPFLVTSSLTIQNFYDPAKPARINTDLQPDSSKNNTRYACKVRVGCVIHLKGNGEQIAVDNLFYDIILHKIFTVKVMLILRVHRTQRHGHDTCLCNIFSCCL